MPTIKVTPMKNPKPIMATTITITTTLKQTKIIHKKKNQTRRVSSLKVSKSKHPLGLDLFQSSGENETISSFDQQRCLVHRYDFIHWRSRDFFSYVQYQYLLDAGSKSKYLEYENLILQPDIMVNESQGPGGLLGLLSGGLYGSQPQRLNRQQVLDIDI